LAFPGKVTVGKIDFPKGRYCSKRILVVRVIENREINLDALENYNLSLKIFEQLKDNAKYS
jgi:hypothetical protein